MERLKRKSLLIVPIIKIKRIQDIKEGTAGLILIYLNIPEGNHFSRGLWWDRKPLTCQLFTIISWLFQLDFEIQYCLAIYSFGRKTVLWIYTLIGKKASPIFHPTCWLVKLEAVAPCLCYIWSFKEVVWISIPKLFSILIVLTKSNDASSSSIPISLVGCTVCCFRKYHPLLIFIH